MRPGFEMKLSLLLLSGILCGTLSAKERVRLAAEEVPAIKNIMVYISEEQTEVSKIMLDPGNSISANSTGSVLADAAGAAIASVIIRSLMDGDAIPPQGTPRSAPGFKETNKSLQSGALAAYMNPAMEAAFEGKSWFERIEISRPTVIVNETRLPKLLKKPQWQGKLPDAALSIKNRFMFGMDYYKLWLVTDLEIYKVRAQNKARQAPIDVKLLHQEKFVSLYDIRDHFEIPKLGSKKRNDISETEKFVINLWNKDDGKLYIDTLKQLVGENAKMIGQFLQQPPSAIASNAEGAAIMALCAIRPRAEEPEKSAGALSPEETQKAAERAAKDLEKRKQERIQDGKVMDGMNPIQRKTYMLLKEYEYARPVDIIENTPERLIARDQDKNVYYSVSGRNIKLVPQNEIDADEYMDTVLESRKYRSIRPVRLR
jgi:hypothetical protein